MVVQCLCSKTKPAAVAVQVFSAGIPQRQSDRASAASLRLCLIGRFEDEQPVDQSLAPTGFMKET